MVVSVGTKNDDGQYILAGTMTMGANCEWTESTLSIP
jgi:hypothetical protein